MGLGSKSGSDTRSGSRGFPGSERVDECDGAVDSLRRAHAKVVDDVGDVGVVEVGEAVGQLEAAGADQLAQALEAGSDSA